ncbi:MAG TPA: S8 family serine peptidase [Trebonia sp.]
MKRALLLTVAGALAAVAALGAAAPAAQAIPATTAASTQRAAGAATAVAADAAYAAPSGAWNRFTSDLDSSGGLATGRGVTVALLSTGADTSAKGLAGKITKGPDYISKATPGSHTSATIIASVILGVPGITQGAAPDARILDLRVMPDRSEAGSKKFFASDDFAYTEGPILAQAITYAVRHGARVIEIDPEIDGGASLGPELPDAVNDAIGKGAVIVAPESSEGCRICNYLYPAGLPGVIGVASTMLPGGISPSQMNPPGTADQSARNNSVLITGPGDWVPATPDGWGPYGTSTAAAYVTSTVALIKQRYPGLSPALVARALAMSARDKPGGGYSTQVGFGVLDPYDAVLDAGTLVRVSTTAAPGPGVVSGKARFGSGPLPAVINALPSAKPEIIGNWAAIGVGAVLLVLAVIVAIRGRRKRRGPQVPVPRAPGPPTFGPQASAPQPMGPEA